MKKGDIKIIILVMIIVIISSVYMLINQSMKQSLILRITKDDVVLHEFKLSDSYENVIRIEDDGEINVVHISNGEVWIEEANCFNQVCVKEKPIDAAGEAIVCLPHKLIIEIVGKKQELDIISE